MCAAWAGASGASSRPWFPTTSIPSTPTSRRASVAGAPAQAGDEEVAPGEASQLGARLLGNLGELGPRDDRRERPVDVEDERAFVGRVGERG